MTDNQTTEDQSVATLEERIGKVIDKLHVVPFPLAYDRKNIALYPDDNPDPEFVNDNHRSALIKELQDLFSQELSIVEKKAKVEGAELLFQAIDAEYKSFAVDVGIGQILQKVRDGLPSKEGCDACRNYGEAWTEVTDINDPHCVKCGKALSKEGGIHD
jgi:hypothetical protein